MKQRKAITLGISIVVFMVMLALAWRMLTLVPVVSRPIVVEQAYAATDGGSVGVEMLDASGLKLMISLRGDLERAPEDFSLYVVRWYGPIPLWRQIKRGSSDEDEVTKLLRNAAKDTTPEKAEFINLFAANLEERSRK